MTKKKRVELRKHKRIKIKGGAFVGAGPNFDQVGQLIDIGMGGLAFHYTACKKQPTGLSLDIFFTNRNFHLSYIPFKAVSDFATANAAPSSSVTTRRTSVQFEKLTDYQELLLSHFIQSQATGEE
ncbi:MAG: hypothetical protein JRF64_11150 [Deltaproteobacteria bacterium]|nr:hypothetical protein [Deltaproteobacteria bacterium]